jgi:transaldolase
MAIKIFADGANLQGMLQMDQMGVDGFTTNPSLMKKGGVQDYRDFAFKVLAAIPQKSISFEVFADDGEGMEAEAREIATWGPNVFVKIPCLRTDGTPTYGLIKRLSDAGVRVNVTAVFTKEQVKAIVEALNPEVPGYISIFAGRLSDAGNDPIPVIEYAVAITRDRPLTEVLWASTREVYNIIQAEQLGADIITVPNNVLDKWFKRGRTPMELSVATVQGFAKDIATLNFRILP